MFDSTELYSPNLDTIQSGRMPIIRREHANRWLGDCAKSTRFDRSRGDENVKLVAHNYNFVETRRETRASQTLEVPT